MMPRRIAEPVSTIHSGAMPRIAVIGGGPAGLYFAILAKKADPAARIEVFERNRADDTFGFGVVFSDSTLDALEAADPQSYAAIARAFAYWDDVAVSIKGREFRIGGNGFCGCSRRDLLRILQLRAKSLGVILHFSREIEALPGPEAADLVVIADGIHSKFRERDAAHFEPQRDLRPNRFAWMGSTRPLDAFHFFFRETASGIFIAHAYQYEAGRSTWVLETDPETFAKAGLGDMSEAQSREFLEQVFAEELQGHRLLGNHSIWRQFPMIRTKNWTKDGRIVLLGDAKASAHFSIGSGTKLAMEDAIDLAAAFRAHPGAIASALAEFEAGRREAVEKTQHAADVSLVWFEHVRRFLAMDPVQFTFGLMTRAKSITYDNLALRAPDFVAKVDAGFAEALARAAPDLPVKPATPPAFQPFRLRGLTLANRLVVSPMCLYRAQEGVPGDFHLVHYGARAMGGAGLIFTEMTCIAPDARISPGCAGLWNDAQAAQWARILGFVKGQGGAKFALQLGHAGRKGATKLMWQGMDRPLEAGGWDLVAPSAVPYYLDSVVPREMTRADMTRVREDFVAAAKRGIAIGFDMLELHAAHGYLLASFLSPITNRRKDDYGGSLENRLRFPIEVFRAIREAAPAEMPISVRISASDWIEGGITSEAAVEIAEAFAAHGADLIDVSSGQTAPQSRPVYGRMFQTPFAEAIRNQAGIATMAVGAITSVDQANTILAAGKADLVAFGRPHLADPNFALRAAAWYGAKAAQPPSYQPGWEQLQRLAARDRDDARELRLKARPKSRKPPLS